MSDTKFDHSRLETIYFTVKSRLASSDIELPALEARIIIEHVTGMHRDKIVLEPDTIISPEDQANIDDLIHQRCVLRKPIAYLIGYREFYGRKFQVNEDVLIPRADSETMIEAIKQKAPSFLDAQSTCLDLGTGSGCLLLTLLLELDLSMGLGVDISIGALNVAKQNAQNHDMKLRAEFCHSNWDDKIDKKERFDLIVSNPPYIPNQDIPLLEPDVKNHEPISALSGSHDGLAYYHILAQIAVTRLTAQGRIFVEIGAGQSEDVILIFKSANLVFIDWYKDFSNHIRILEFAK